MSHSLIWWCFIFSWFGVGVKLDTGKLKRQEAQESVNLQLRIKKLEMENGWLETRNQSLLKGTPPWNPS